MTKTYSNKKEYEQDNQYLVIYTNRYNEKSIEACCKTKKQASKELEKLQEKNLGISMFDNLEIVTRRKYKKENGK